MALNKAEAQIWNGVCASLADLEFQATSEPVYIPVAKPPKTIIDLMYAILQGGYNHRIDPDAYESATHFVEAVMLARQPNDIVGRLACRQSESKGLEVLLSYPASGGDFGY